MIAAPTSTIAQQQQSSIPEPYASCTLERIDRERLENKINTAAENARTSEPIIKELEQINKKAKDPTKPIDPASVYWGVIQVLRQISPADKTPATMPPPFQKCTEEWAITVHEEDESVTRLSQLKDQVTRGFQQLREIASEQGRTQEQGIDPAQLSPTEKALIADFQRMVLLPADKEKTYIGDMENLKSLAAASDIIYTSNKRDFLSSGGNLNAIGTGIAKANYDDRTRAMLGVWEEISAKVPTEWEQQWKAINNARTGIQ